MGAPKVDELIRVFAPVGAQARTEYFGMGDQSGFLLDEVSHHVGSFAGDNPEHALCIDLGVLEPCSVGVIAMVSDVVQALRRIL